MIFNRSDSTASKIANAGFFLLFAMYAWGSVFAASTTILFLFDKVCAFAIVLVVLSSRSISHGKMLGMRFLKLYFGIGILLTLSIITIIIYKNPPVPIQEKLRVILLSLGNTVKNTIQYPLPALLLSLLAHRYFFEDVTAKDLSTRISKTTASSISPPPKTRFLHRALRNLRYA